MSEALRKAAQAALEALEQLDGVDTETEVVTIYVSDEIEALRVALAESESKEQSSARYEQSEPVAYQYRWTNPGNLQHAHPAGLDWKPVELRHCETIPEEAAQLERYTYDEKPTYEVRKLFAAPPRRDPLTQTQALSLWRASEFRGNGGQADWFAEGIRAAEKHHGIGGKEC